jgi:hypothetical protein
MHIFAYYSPSEINERDQEAHDLVAPYVTRRIGSGTMLETNERDIQWEVKPEHAAAAISALEGAGFRAELRDHRADSNLSM